MRCLIGKICLIVTLVALGACGGEVDVNSPATTSGERNSVPVADFSYEVNGTTLFLDASKSVDPDGDSLSYTWYVGGSEQRTEMQTQVVFYEMGRHTVHLVVSDNEYHISKTLMFDVLDSTMVPHPVGTFPTPTPSVPPVNEQDPQLERGRTLYQSAVQDCQGCHGANGQLATFKAIDPTREFYQHSAAGDAQYTLEEYLTEWMPVGATNKCENDCAADIAYYIRSWNSTTPQPTPTTMPQPSVMPEPTVIPEPTVMPEPTAQPTPVVLPTPTPTMAPMPGVDVVVVRKSNPGTSPLASGSAPLLAELRNGVGVNLMNTQYVDIEAIPKNISMVGSVTMDLSGQSSLSRTERAAGYFLNGDEGFFDRNDSQFAVGSYQLTVTVNDPAGQALVSRTIDFTVVENDTANQPPVADAQNSANLSGEAPLWVSFNASASVDDNEILSYAWSFGDGSPDAEGETLQHPYNQAGNYTATLTVVDGAGLSDTTEVSIIVTAPETQPTFDAAAFFAGNCVACHGSDGSGNSAFGDSTILRDKTFLRATLEAAIARMPSPGSPACEGDQSCISGLADYIFTFAVEETAPEVGLSCEQQEGLLAPKARRLTASQFKNSVTTIFSSSFNGIAWPQFGDSLPTIGMSNNADSLRINNINVESVYTSVDAVVSNVLANHQAINACVNNSDEACVNNLLSQYAPLLWRRPLSSGELEDIRSALARLRTEGLNNSRQLEFVFKSLLLSSNFLFRSEFGTLENGVRSLSDYEIASIMSYAIWDSPPDATLYNLAASGQLQDPAVISQQVARMTQDARFSSVLVDFYKDYLKLDRVLSVEKIAELNFTPAIRDALLRSAELSLEGRLEGNVEADITAAFQGNSYYVNDETAHLFGLSGNNFGANLTQTAMSTEERNGILTHPAFLSVHSKEGASGIVKRGVFVLEQMLCKDLGDPPDELTEAELPEEVDPATTTTRELLHLQHSSQPVCAGCHVTIDPAGFGFENYDAIGQFRLFEKGTVAIDAEGTLDVGSSILAFSNGVEYTAELLDTPELRACVSRRFTEYMVGQNLSANSCELAKLSDHTATNGTSIDSVLNGLMRLESVRKRGN